MLQQIRLASIGQATKQSPIWSCLRKRGWSFYRRWIWGTVSFEKIRFLPDSLVRNPWWLKKSLMRLELWISDIPRSGAKTIIHTIIVLQYQACQTETRWLQILSWTALGWYQFLWHEINRRFISSRVSLFAFEYFSGQLSQIFCMILCVYYFSEAEMIESNRKLQKIRYRSALEHISHQKSGVELGRFFNLRIFLGRFSYGKWFLILSS